MDYSHKTCAELREICKASALTGYSKMKKDELIQLLSTNESVQTTNEPTVRTVDISPNASRTMIDLFAGTGAFTFAFEQTGRVTNVFANDMVDWSKIMYDQNFTHSSIPGSKYDRQLTLANLNDISVSDIPNHDILTGGFPCQPFSIAGKRAGFHDVRSNVFWKILEIVDHHQPSCIVLENVKNLVSHDDGNTFTTIRQHLTDRGYHIRYKVLDTALITGIPQHRERIYIVGVKSKEVYDKFSLDFDEKPMLPISDLLQTTPVPPKYYYTDRSSTWPLVSTSVTKENTVYQYRRVYVRENKSNMCPTLTANMGTGGHNVPLIRDQFGIRKLTPRECFNFQGFPESYILPPELSDCNLYKMAGNAVSVPVVQLIANRLVPLLCQAHQEVLSSASALPSNQELTPGVPPYPTEQNRTSSDLTEP